jgi:acetyl-CoA acyltransferase
MFARRAKAYRETYGLAERDLARVVVKAYDNANKNPHAHMHAVTMTLEGASTASDKNPLFIENPSYHDWLKVSDCSQVSDGASALLLVSEAGLRGLGKQLADASEILAYGHAVSPLEGMADPLFMHTAHAAAREAYRDAGLGTRDIDVAEVHDCFSITELELYEALDFAPKGHAIDLVKDGTVLLNGKLPVNTGGGLMAFGHPVGATGVKQALEIFKQQKGLCGDYQMKSRPAHGITANVGGDDRTAVVTIIRNVT